MLNINLFEFETSSMWGTGSFNWHDTHSKHYLKIIRKSWVHKKQTPELKTFSVRFEVSTYKLLYKFGERQNE